MNIATDGLPRVERLDLAAVPPGTSARMWVRLADDALGRPISVPVVVVRGAEDGPVLGLTAAVHGNEINGLPVIQRLVRHLDPRRLKGTVVGVLVVNVPGFLSQVRGSLERNDLNHAFPGRADGSAIEVFAWRLMDRLVGRFDVLLDLHTASFGRVNSLYVRADLTDPRVEAIARALRPQIIVDNPAHPQTLRGAVAAAGKAAVTIEIGNPHRFHGEYVKHSVSGVRAVLVQLGMLNAKPAVERAPPVVCSGSGWLHTSAGGVLTVLPRVAEFVEAGEVVARLHNVFGDELQEIISPERAVVVGHSVAPVAHTGARVIHLGQPRADQGGT